MFTLEETYFKALMRRYADEYRIVRVALSGEADYIASL